MRKLHSCKVRVLGFGIEEFLCASLRCSIFFLWKYKAVLKQNYHHSYQYKETYIRLRRLLYSNITLESILSLAKNLKLGTFTVLSMPGIKCRKISNKYHLFLVKTYLKSSLKTHENTLLS
jgi:hypothetical protein